MHTNALSHRSWLNYYPGDQYVDVMSWDVYGFNESDTNHTNNQTIEQHQTTSPSLAVTLARGKPYSVSELGYDDATDRAAFLDDFANLARSNNTVFVAYFDFIGALGDHRLTDTASQQAWRSAINGSLFARPPTASNNPATGVTSTSATTVSDGPETVTYTRTGLSHSTNYTFRCKVYDASNTLVLKPPTLTFTTAA